jgi:hypothetical protein
MWRCAAKRYDIVSGLSEKNNRCVGILSLLHVCEPLITY